MLIPTRPQIDIPGLSRPIAPELALAAGSFSPPIAIPTAAPPISGPNATAPGAIMHRPARLYALLLATVLMLIPSPAEATWSIIAVDARTGLVVIALNTSAS